MAFHTGAAKAKDLRQEVSSPVAFLHAKPWLETIFPAERLQPCGCTQGAYWGLGVGAAGGCCGRRCCAKNATVRSQASLAAASS